MKFFISGDKSTVIIHFRENEQGFLSDDNNTCDFYLMNRPAPVHLNLYLYRNSNYEIDVQDGEVEITLYRIFLLCHDLCTEVFDEEEREAICTTS